MLLVRPGAFPGLEWLSNPSLSLSVFGVVARAQQHQNRQEFTASSWCSWLVAHGP